MLPLVLRVSIYCNYSATLLQPIPTLYRDPLGKPLTGKETLPYRPTVVRAITVATRPA